MNRVVVVSNRVVEFRKASQAGGVAVVLADFLRTHPSLWFGWNGTISDEPDAGVAISNPRKSKGSLATLTLSAEEHRDYYLGYSNSVLWPVFHNRLDLARFDAGFYPRYVDVNRRFADALAPLLRRTDVIWIHDYHLIPLAAELRLRGIENPIGFFLHIAVPPSEGFLAIPEHRALAEALAAYDLVGVQTKNDVANLIRALQESSGARLLQDGRLAVGNRRVAIESFPVGIKVSDFEMPRDQDVPPSGQAQIQRIIGVDRLDYTKGLPQKFRAFGQFLEKYPQYRGHVVLSQIAPPTRETVGAYAEVRNTLEALSGKINGLYGDLEWTPIHYIHRTAPRKRLAGIYRMSRIGLFTPLRDGMNLVAKEYVAAQDRADPGVVILSRFAGAAEQLEDAIIVNPYNIGEMADALNAAFAMGRAERIARHERLLATVTKHDVVDWAQRFLTSLRDCAATRRREGTVLSPGICDALARLDESLKSRKEARRKKSPSSRRSKKDVTARVIGRGLPVTF